jgi:hypothetical protein
VRRRDERGSINVHPFVMCRNPTTGFLNVRSGTSLRSYLADTLNCDPMRVTKKVLQLPGRRPVLGTLRNPSSVDMRAHFLSLRAPHSSRRRTSSASSRMRPPRAGRSRRRASRPPCRSCASSSVRSGRAAASESRSKSSCATRPKCHTVTAKTCGIPSRTSSPPASPRPR